MSRIRTIAALIAALILTGLGAALLTLPPAPRPPAGDDIVLSAASAKVGSPMTREQVIQRAQSWVDQKVPYSQKGAWPEKAIGREWRTDCSGFVSMAWMLPASETTRTLPDVAEPISTAELLPGDILNSPEHVVLFAGWIDKAKGTFTFYQESNSSRPTNKSTGSLKADLLSNHPVSSYTARRYIRILGQAPAPPPPATPAPAPPSAPEPSVPAPSGSAGKPKPSASAPAPAPSFPSGPRAWANAGTQLCLEIRGDAVEDGATANQWTCNNSRTQRWTTTNPGGWGTIVNVNSGKCLEIRGDAVEDGATANQWTCNNSPTQSWRWQPASAGGFTLVNANSGKCLSIRLRGDGTLADQQKCSGTPAQTWK
ncbi:RICIN domain-containing protein [Streptomyces sp. NPDC006487]|uniref:RICIN domain-containing protein n=1 Tax=Streptomyces sp. NPDC006487 TaxID=3364748 RepID=UPI0036A651D5